MKRKIKTTLIVGTIATLIATGVTGIAIATEKLSPLQLAGATGQPLVLDIINDTKVNGDATHVTTTGGANIKVAANITTEEDSTHKMKSFANLDRIGNIVGFYLELNPSQQTSSFNLDFGYETDADGNPIYVKENLEIAGDEVKHIADKKFQWIAHAGNPNFIRIELNNPTWNPLPVKSFKILYGNNSLDGDAQCAPVETPHIFKSNVRFDMVDAAKEDVKFEYKSISPKWRGDEAFYSGTLTNPKAGDKFFVKADEAVIAIPDVTKFAEFVTKGADNSITLNKDLNGTITVTATIKPDGTNTATFALESKDVYTQKDIAINIYRRNEKIHYGWEVIACENYANKIYTFKNIYCNGGDPKYGADGTATLFQILDRSATPSQKAWNILKDGQDPTIANKLGNNIAIGKTGTYDIIFDDSGASPVISVIASK